MSNASPPSPPNPLVELLRDVHANMKPTDAGAVSLSAFLAEVPPGRQALVKLRFEASRYPGTQEAVIPATTLYCSHELCDGLRQFETETKLQARPGKHVNMYVNVTCSNCKSSSKCFSLRIDMDGSGMGPVRVQKYGELPPFGAHTPTRLLNLLGSERDLYLKGRRAEQQAMGIAAFAYYRRVVDNKRVQLLDRIIAVAKTGTDTALIEELEAAKRESQFTEAVKRIKHALPEVLLIKGENPLLLLYGALSEGLHNRSDEECLEAAGAVRLVLTGFVERLAAALEEDKDLIHAMKVLKEHRGKRPV